MARVNTRSAKVRSGPSQPSKAMDSTVAKAKVETPNATSPIKMTGVRPHRSLRRPQNGDENTQIVAEIAKIKPICNSVEIVKIEPM